MKSTIQDVSKQLMRQSETNLEVKMLTQVHSPDTSMQNDESIDFSSHNLSKFLDQETHPVTSPDQSGCDLKIQLNDDNPVTMIQNADTVILTTDNNNTPKTTLATKAVDELYTLIVSFCNVIEVFFQPYYPTEVTYDLHNDFMLLVQHMIFRVQEGGKVYECLTVLMRVDSQIDDKDLREKMRLCREYSPIDFGIEHDFSMTAPQNIL